MTMRIGRMLDRRRFAAAASAGPARIERFRTEPSDLRPVSCVEGHVRSSTRLQPKTG
jgi:hypothetical protein